MVASFGSSSRAGRMPRRRNRPFRAGQKVVVLLVALVLAAAAGVGVYFLVRGGGGDGNGEGDGKPAETIAAVRYLPDDSFLIISVRLQQLLGSDAVKKLFDKFPGAKQLVADLHGDFTKQCGLAPESIERETVAVRSDLAGEDPLGVYDLNEAVDPESMFAKAEEAWEKTDHEGAALYVGGPRGEQGAYFPDERTFVIGPEKVVRRIIERNSEPKLADALRRQLGDLDASKTLIAAMAITKDMQDGLEKMQGRRNPDIPPPLIRPLREGTASLWIELQAEGGFAVRTGAICEDEQAAEDLRKAFDGWIDELRDTPFLAVAVADALKKIATSTEGAGAVAQLEMSADDLIGLIEQAVGPKPRPGRFKTEAYKTKAYKTIAKTPAAPRFPDKVAPKEKGKYAPGEKQ